MYLRLDGVANSKKLGESKQIFFPGEQYKVTIYNLYIHGTPPLNQQKNFQQFCANLKRGLNLSGGVRNKGMHGPDFVGPARRPHGPARPAGPNWV